MDDREAYITDVYVLPDYRNKGVGILITEESLRFLAEKGYKKVRAIAINHYSFIIFEKLKFIHKATRIYFKLFGFKILLHFRE